MVGGYSGFPFVRGWHLESMGEVYSANLSNGMVIVTSQKVCYLTTKGLVINQKATEIG